MSAVDEYRKKIGQGVNKKSEFPTGPYLAIIEFGSTSYQTEYGNHDGRLDTMTVEYMNMRWWHKEDRQYWLDRMQELMTGYCKKEFIALEDGKIVEPKLSVQVNV